MPEKTPAHQLAEHELAHLRRERETRGQIDFEQVAAARKIAGLPAKTEGEKVKSND